MTDYAMVSDVHKHSKLVLPSLQEAQEAKISSKYGENPLRSIEVRAMLVAVQQPLAV